MNLVGIGVIAFVLGAIFLIYSLLRKRYNQQ